MGTKEGKHTGRKNRNIVSGHTLGQGIGTKEEYGKEE